MVCQVATDSPHTSHYLPRARGPYWPDLWQSRHTGQGRARRRGAKETALRQYLSAVRSFQPMALPGRKAAFGEIFLGTCLWEQRVPCQATGSD